jgi:hypothetical protein
MKDVQFRERNMTKEEIRDLVAKITELRERGWSIAQVADHLGYSNPSVLYSAVRDLRGIEIARFRRLCRLHADGATPPETRRPRKEPILPDERVDYFPDVVSRLQRAGFTHEAQAQLAGYGSGAGLGMAIRARRIPTEVYARIVGFGVEQRLVKDAVDLPVTNPRATRGGWTAMEYFRALSGQLEQCAHLMDEAALQLSNPLTGPGYKRFASRLRRMATEARKVV